jgi:hypothetical protein
MATFLTQQQCQLAINQTQFAIDLVERVQQQMQRKQEAIEQKELCHQVWASTHAVTILRLNNSDVKRPYYAIRRKRSDMSGAIMKL